MLGDPVKLFRATYVHIKSLSISFLPADNRCDHNQLVLRYKVPYASLVFRGFVARVRLDVEFEGGGEGQDSEEEQDSKELP